MVKICDVDFYFKKITRFVDHFQQPFFLAVNILKIMIVNLASRELSFDDVLLSNEMMLRLLQLNELKFFQEVGMKTILITGANRGIGLEFSRQYMMAGWQVLACCRQPDAAGALNDLAAHNPGKINVHALDVANHEQIEQLSAKLSHQPIDVLVNNAGIYPSSRRDDFGKTDYDAWSSAFQVNTMAPLKMAESFIKQITKSDSKTIVTITSKMGSIADNQRGGSYIYRSSKSAVNIVVKSLAIDLKDAGITAVLLHPGWVRTDMGGPNGLISTEQSVTGMRQVISNLTQADSGKFYAFDGQIVPW